MTPYLVILGAVWVMAPADKFYGDRQAVAKDPSGNLWWIATHVEDVAPDELWRRAEETHGRGALMPGDRLRNCA